MPGRIEVLSGVEAGEAVVLQPESGVNDLQMPAENLQLAPGDQQ